MSNTTVSLVKDSRDYRVKVARIALNRHQREAADMTRRVELNPFAAPAMIRQPTSPLVRV